jgi:hypothetical protein
VVGQSGVLDSPGHLESRSGRLLSGFTSLVVVLLNVGQHGGAGDGVGVCASKSLSSHLLASDRTTRWGEGLAPPPLRWILEALAGPATASSPATTARITSGRSRLMLNMMLPFPGGLGVGGYDPEPAAQVGQMQPGRGELGQKHSAALTDDHGDLEPGVVPGKLEPGLATSRREVPNRPFAPPLGPCLRFQPGARPGAPRTPQPPRPSMRLRCARRPPPWPPRTVAVRAERASPLTLTTCSPRTSSGRAEGRFGVSADARLPDKGGVRRRLAW